MKKPTTIKTKLIPLSLTVFVIALDQISKVLVYKNVSPWSVGKAWLNDFFRIIHVYNPGIAFSLGGTLSASIRSVLFGIMPLIVIGVVLYIYFKNNSFTFLQRWSIAGIVGGGIGNLIDRFFRKEGVLDFIDVKFYGIFGLDRWPTFNIADASVVICGFLLLISLFVERDNEENLEKQDIEN